jgi:hypothetical protein
MFVSVKVVLRRSFGEKCNSFILFRSGKLISRGDQRHISIPGKKTEIIILFRIYSRNIVLNISLSTIGDADLRQVEVLGCWGCEDDGSLKITKI